MIAALLATSFLPHPTALGGLLGGPFGAIWGAQLGGAMGARRGAQKSEEARLEKMGLSREVREAAAACAADLAEAEEGLSACREALQSARALESQLEASSAAAYAEAEAALRAGDEAAARACLERRQQSKGQLGKARLEAAEANDRVVRMEAALSALAERSKAIEAAMSRAVASSAVSAADRAVTRLDEDDDPLLRRFRDLEGR